MEQLYIFVLITFVSILFTSLPTYSTVFGMPDLPDDIGFIRVEGEQLSATVGPWFGAFFWGVEAFALFAAALGIVDHTSRLAADVLKTSYFPQAEESTIYSALLTEGVFTAAQRVARSGRDMAVEQGAHFMVVIGG